MASLVSPVLLLLIATSTWASSHLHRHKRSGQSTPLLQVEHSSPLTLLLGKDSFHIRLILLMLMEFHNVDNVDGVDVYT